MAVIGSKQTKEMLVFINSEDEWRKCGAFCVRFHDGGKEDIVIVDDFFPFY